MSILSVLRQLLSHLTAPKLSHFPPFGSARTPTYYPSRSRILKNKDAIQAHICQSVANSQKTLSCMARSELLTSEH